MDESNRPVTDALVEEGSPVVFVLGEEGPLGDALRRAGPNFVCLVVIPVRTPVRTLGLLSYYLSAEASVPRQQSVSHLARHGQGLAVAMELASGSIASERLQRLERTAMVGQLAEQAILETGAPLDRLFTAVGRLRGREDGPPWLSNEVLGIRTDLARTKRYRDGVLGFMAGQLPSAPPELPEPRNVSGTRTPPAAGLRVISWRFL